MTPELLENLHSASAAIRERWERLLRIERVNGPLANPDALVHLLPETLEAIFATLAKRPRARLSFERAIGERLPACQCGNNPYLAYFTAAEQALVETVVLLQAKQPENRQNQNDVAEAIKAVRGLARSEIDTFCGVCTHHGMAAGCRYVPA